MLVQSWWKRKASHGVALEGSLERNEELGLGKARRRTFQEEETEYKNPEAK